MKTGIDIYYLTGRNGKPVRVLRFSDQKVVVKDEDSDGPPYTVDLAELEMIDGNGIEKR